MQLLYSAVKTVSSTSAILLVMLLAAVSPALAEVAPPPPASELHEQGREIYNFRCYYCHGYSGDARTLAATMLSVRPRDFTSPEAKGLSRERMIDVVTNGIEGGPMRGFSRMLERREIALVVDFVRQEFIEQGAINTLYHTAGNGWPDHQRYRIAWPFATGELAIDAPASELDPQQIAGRQLFLESCISCHDRGRVIDEGAPWSAQAVSYPRNGFRPGDPLLPVDGVTGATLFSLHEIPPQLDGVSAAARAGSELFQANCAFCHAADGSGKNWIGTFMEPPARDLTADPVMASMTVARLRTVIENGIVGSSMPAWRGVLDQQQIAQLIAYVDEVLHPLADGRGRGGW